MFYGFIFWGCHFYRNKKCDMDFYCEVFCRVWASANIKYEQRLFTTSLFSAYITNINSFFIIECLHEKTTYSYFTSYYFFLIWTATRSLYFILRIIYFLFKPYHHELTLMKLNYGVKLLYIFSQLHLVSPQKVWPEEETNPWYLC